MLRCRHLESESSVFEVYLFVFEWIRDDDDDDDDDERSEEQQ
jgi:hypothetical protein